MATAKSANMQLDRKMEFGRNRSRKWFLQFLSTGHPDEAINAEKIEERNATARRSFAISAFSAAGCPHERDMVDANNGVQSRTKKRN